MKVNSGSGKYYYLLLVVALVILCIFDWICIIPQVRDIGVNVLTDAAFAVFTIVFLDRIVIAREGRRQRVLERVVLTTLSRRLYEIFFTLEYWLSPKGVYGARSNRSIRVRLRDFSVKEDADLTENFDAFAPPPRYPFDSDLRELLESSDYFRGFDMTYSEFLKPVIRASILKIEGLIDSLSEDISLIKENDYSGPYVNGCRQGIANTALRIIKEINAVDENGLEISRRLE